MRLIFYSFLISSCFRYYPPTTEPNETHTYREAKKKGKYRPSGFVSPQNSSRHSALQRPPHGNITGENLKLKKTPSTPPETHRRARTVSHAAAALLLRCVFLSFSFLNVVVFFFWFSLLTLLWAGRRPFLFGRRWFRLDGGSCWANAESREGGGFFFSLSLCVVVWNPAGI